MELTSWPLTPGDVYDIRSQGVHPLALLGVLAIITQVDGSGAPLGQLSVIGRHDGAPQNLKGLLVTGHQHTHMVWQPHLCVSGQLVSAIETGKGKMSHRSIVPDKNMFVEADAQVTDQGDITLLAVT